MDALENMGDGYRARFRQVVTKMNSEELDKILGKKINGWAQEGTDQFYIMLTLTYGKTVVFRSESPIHVEVETEN